MVKKVILGETEIAIHKHKSENTDSIIFLNVHEDEQTSIDVLNAYATTDSIDFFYLKHIQTRRVAFQLEGETYSIDPNRIFTGRGRRKTLKDGGAFSRPAKKTAKYLAKEILALIPQGHTVVAMHNNTDVNYSIKSYLPGGDEAQNTANININEEWDADDFIYTTDPLFFERFKVRGLNVILQDNNGYVNDGSLSVYCGKKGIPYINIETQKGHYEEQMALLKIVLEVLRSGS